MTEQPTLDALTQQRDREYLERLLAYRTRALSRVIAERDEARAALTRVEAVAGEWEADWHNGHTDPSFAARFGAAYRIREALKPRETKP